MDKTGVLGSGSSRTLNKITSKSGLNSFNIEKQTVNAKNDVVLTYKSQNAYLSRSNLPLRKGKINPLKLRELQASLTVFECNNNKCLNRPFSYSTKEPGSSVIFIHFYTRGSIEWLQSFFHYCSYSKILQNVANYRSILVLFRMAKRSIVPPDWLKAKFEYGITLRGPKVGPLLKRNILSPC